MGKRRKDRRGNEEVEKGQERRGEEGGGRKRIFHQDPIFLFESFMLFWS